ncbi:MAG: aminotransferase class IV [Pseudomonadota bacterium]
MPDISHRSAHDAEADARNEELLIWVDGALVPKAEAVVSVYDSGFMLGDGVWEGLRVHNARPAFLEAHLDRLYEAAFAIDLDIGMERAALTEALYATLAANGITENAHIRLMVTRGRKKKPFQDPRLSVFGSTLVIIAEHSVPTTGGGLRLMTVPQHRGLPLTQDPKLNSHSKLNCIIPLIHALKAGADEALMLDPHGWVNTTNACNFFIVRGGAVWTSTGDYCMNGITRGHVIALCRAHGIPIFEKNFSLLECYGAEEAFVTGTFGAQTPVVEIDGRRISDGMGPVTRRIRSLYKDLIAQDVGATA